jgi:glycosyltransferase involved in cell wall biosynthesis
VAETRGKRTKNVLVLAYSEGLNGTTVHQRSFRSLFSLVPGYAFTVLENTKQLKGRYDLYLNLTPPYDISADGRDHGHFYYYTTEWIRRSVWRPVRDIYRCLPPGFRHRLKDAKQFLLRHLIGSLPPAEEWIVLCHDLSPVIRREWFDFPAHWKIDFLSNYRKAKRVIAVSESTRRDLVENGIPAERVSVVYNTHDTDFGLQNGASRALEEDYFLVVGSFEPRKNAKTVYEAFAKLRSLTDAGLVFVGGDGWGDRSVYEAIRRDPRCRVLEKVSKEELVGLYHGARALVYASWYEGFGLPVLEAAACGVPVVCSQNSGMLESGEGYAEYADPSSAEDIARAMRKVLEPGYRVDREARERLLLKFSAVENAKRLKAVLDEVSGLS